MEQENKPKETTQWIVTILIAGGLILCGISAIFDWVVIGIVSSIMIAIGLVIIAWGFLTDMNKE